jgi:two-component system, NtrC family, sensor histidine kinase PilS
MFSLVEKDFQANDGITNRIHLLIIGRLMIIFLLLITTWFWNSGHLKFSIEDYPRGLLLVFLISVGLTIVYFFLLRLNKSYDWQIRLQFVLDSLLITWLIWRTGDITSPYITLFIVLIAVSSIYLPPRGTLSFALLCFILFTGLAILVSSSLIYSFNEVPTLPKVVQIVAFHDVAFLVVGLLAARLSARHASSGDRLRETEQSLINLRVLHERIVESIRSGLITTDLEGHIYTFNIAAEEITHHKAKDMVGKSIFSLLGNIEYSILPSLERTETGEQPLRFQTDILTPEGFIVHIGYGVSPLFAENGEKSGLIITFQDLTEIRSMEESIRRKDRLAAVGRVAAGLAHEIRNPLGAMRGAIQVLQLQTPPDTSQASLMEIILRESDRLNKIISNFLTYARPRVNNFLDTDVCESLSDTFTLLKHSPDIKESHILECNLPESEIIISADQTQLKQIFWNLARNAVQAMPNGGKLNVRLKKLANKRIQIVFSDTGCGMPPEQVEQLFEPFSTSTTGGTGLGLSIVYQIVRDHGGTINVRSMEGEGTTITVELPSDYRNQNVSVEVENIEVSTIPSRIEEFLTIQSGEK